MGTDKRRIIRIGDESYELLLEIQKNYIKEIGFSPTLKQLINLGITALINSKEFLKNNK